MKISKLPMREGGDAYLPEPQAGKPMSHEAEKCSHNCVEPISGLCIFCGTKPAAPYVPQAEEDVVAMLASNVVSELAQKKIEEGNYEPAFEELCSILHSERRARREAEKTFDRVQDAYAYQNRLREAAESERDALGKLQHIPICSYQTLPVGSPGCVCIIISKHEFSTNKERISSLEALVESERDAFETRIDEEAAYYQKRISSLESTVRELANLLGNAITGGFILDEVNAALSSTLVKELLEKKG